MNITHRRRHPTFLFTRDANLDLATPIFEVNPALSILLSCWTWCRDLTREHGFSLGEDEYRLRTPRQHDKLRNHIINGDSITGWVHQITRLNHSPKTPKDHHL